MVAYINCVSLKTNQTKYIVLLQLHYVIILLLRMSFDCFRCFFSKKLGRVLIINFLFHFLEAQNQNVRLVSYFTRENSYLITLKQKDL